MNYQTLITLGFTILCLGCGTIVGNPKKPDSGDNPDVQKINIVQIPVLELPIPESTLSDADLLQSQFHLQPGSDQPGNDRGILVEWSRRVDRINREIIKTARKINRAIARTEINDSGVVEFSGIGKNKSLSGFLTKRDNAYEATICHNSVPFFMIEWQQKEVLTNEEDEEEVDEATVRELTSSLQFTRNLALGDESESQLDLLTTVAIAFNEDASRTYSINSSGVWDFSDKSGGFAEYAEIDIPADGPLGIRSVVDRFEEEPEAFEPDRYLTGRLYRGDGTASPRGSEFIAYNSASTLLCRNGFDETRDDLWAPAAFATPRWCLGRPLGKKKFDSFEDFLSTVADLESVGVASKENLKVLTLDETVSCSPE